MKENNFPCNLKSLRLQANLTQKQVATQLNLSTNNIGHWEKGRTQPDLQTLIKISELFDVTLDELIL